VWTSIEGSKPVTLFGFQYQVGVEPVHVNIDAMIANFRQGLADPEPIWRQMLAAETLEGLFLLKECPPPAFHIPDDLRTRIAYDVAIADHLHSTPREHSFKALTPLYRCSTAASARDTQ